MKKRIVSFMGSLMVFCMVMGVSILNVKASDKKMVDGSYLTTEEKSVGYASSRTRGVYLMDGECSITKAGRNRVYAYGSTTANMQVGYMMTIVCVDQYQEEEDEWWQIDAWMEEVYDDYYMSMSKTLTVDRGYYYRVRAYHHAGDVYPYDEAVSFTNGILVP